MTVDERYEAIRLRLSKLASTELRRVLAAGEMVYDQYHYDELTGRF